jgi:hypothetical protein
MFMIFWECFAGNSDLLHKTVGGSIIGLFAGLNGVLLVAAWLENSQKWAERAMLASMAVFLAATSLLVFQKNPEWLVAGLCGVLAEVAFGSYLLEVADQRKIKGWHPTSALFDAAPDLLSEE